MEKFNRKKSGMSGEGTENKKGVKKEKGTEEVKDKQTKEEVKKEQEREEVKNTDTGNGLEHCSVKKKISL